MCCCYYSLTDGYQWLKRIWGETFLEEGWWMCGGFEASAWYYGNLGIVCAETEWAMLPGTSSKPSQLHFTTWKWRGGGNEILGRRIVRVKTTVVVQRTKMSWIVFPSSGTWQVGVLWQGGTGGVWRGEGDGWLTSACAVPNPRKTKDQPQRDLNQPSHGQPVASCTFLCFPGFSISGSLENDRLSWHQSAHTLLAYAAQHFCQVTKRERLMTTSAEALAGLRGGRRRSYLPKSPQEVLAQEWNCTQVNGFVLQIWSWFKLGDIPITWKQSALWCWHQLLAAHGTWEVLSACLLHRTCSESRSTLSSTLTQDICCATTGICLLTGKSDMLSLGNASCVGSHLVATCSAFRREHWVIINIVLMAEDFLVLQMFRCEDSEADACKVQCQDVASQTLEMTLEGFWYCLSPSHSQDHTFCLFECGALGNLILVSFRSWAQCILSLFYCCTEAICVVAEMSFLLTFLCSHRDLSWEQSSSNGLLLQSKMSYFFLLWSTKDPVSARMPSAAQPSNVIINLLASTLKSCGCCAKIDCGN